MHATENTTDRLVLRSTSPLFRPFFVGGLGLLVVGGVLLIGGPHLGAAPAGPVSSDEPPIAPPGLGMFLATFGFFLAVAPLIGRFPYRKEVVVDRAAGQFIRRDRTLLRLREEAFPLGDVRGVDVEEARHVDGDAYYTLVLRLESGDGVTLDRFTDRSAAGSSARLIRDHLERDLPRRPADASDPSSG